MAESGYGHVGRIPNYGMRGQPDNRGMAEAPACIQNAMMTKDKKPFTYTPGGLDLSQIKTPSMARRLARQRSNEDAEQAYAAQQALANGGGNQQSQQTRCNPPPPPPSGPPPPPPPPPLVIHAPNANSAKPETIIKPIGERPEIVIPENPIGMLRKTNSPYHWEQEKAEKDRMAAVPKFVEKAPSPLLYQNQPAAFSEQPPATYTPQVSNNTGGQNYPYNKMVHQSPESPLHKPEPQYPPKTSIPSPVAQAPTRDLLQRQDSQFNKSPTPFGPQSINSSPVANSSPISPSVNSPWRQPERQSPAVSNASPQQRSPFSPTNSNASPQFTPNNGTPSPGYQHESPSPNVYHTLPRASPRVQDNFTNNIRQSPPKNVFNNTIYNNVRNERAESPKVELSKSAPWRSQTLNRNPREENNNYIQASNNQNNNQQLYRSNENQVLQNNVQQQQWKSQQNENPWKSQQQPYQQQQPNNTNQWQQPQQPEANQLRGNQQPYPNPWKQNQQPKAQSPPVMVGNQPGEVRYQSHMQIPVTPRIQPRNPQPEPERPHPQPNREIVYVTQEPVYYHDPGSPKSVPLFAQKQKEKTPPPEWVQRPLDGRKSLSRELMSPPREKPVEPEWVQRSEEMRRAGRGRDLSSPPLIHQTVEPTWSTKPSENRKSIPRDTQPTFNHGPQNRGMADQQPHLRIIIDMNQDPQLQNHQAQPPYSQPTQRIMRVLSPQLVRLDQPDAPSQPELPSLSQPKTRIIPIQLEGASNEAPNRRVYYHHFSYEGPPRQSKAFRVLQAITGTQELDDIEGMEENYGFSDL